MAFFLKRGGPNVPLEVQRWQYFLLKQNIPQVGRIDGQFGLKSEEATKFFQIQRAIAVTGEFDAATRSAAKTLGYTVVSDDHYDDKKTAAFPPRPTDLSSPDNADRNAGLGCFKFKQLPRPRPDPDEIVILGSCDGTIADWRQTNIVSIAIPQLRFAKGFGGTITCHKTAAPHIKALFEKWEELDLLHLIRDYDGTFSPRYKRGQSPPGNGGHGVKQSRNVEALSNHAFGSAFDINAEDNPFGERPALCPMRGCVRELVAAANQMGFFWGGHFNSSKDGMHFEFAGF
jgi:hypothetical protein